MVPADPEERSSPRRFLWPLSAPGFRALEEPDLTNERERLNLVLRQVSAPNPLKRLRPRQTSYGLEARVGRLLAKRAGVGRPLSEAARDHVPND
jgi:hypothetical protein